VAWHSEKPNENGRSLRLYRVAFANPHPEKIIRAIGFESAMNRPSMFVAALTLDPLMPGARPDNLTSDEFPDPELGGLLALTVQDDKGRALPGAEVSIHFASKLDAPGQKLFTDNGGSLVVRYPDAGLTSLEVSAEHEGFSGKKVKWDTRSGDKIPDSYTLKLGVEVKIGGIVVDENDNPISGADIRFYRFWSSQDDSPDKNGEQASFSSRSVKPDAAGRWNANGLPSTLLANIGGDIKHPDFVGTNIYLREAGTTRDELVAGTFKTILHRGLEVTGRVLDDAGNAVAGATVFAGQRYYRERQQMTTDGDGRFHFGRMAQGNLEFSVIAKGRLPAVKTVAVESGMAEIIFRLGPGKLIRGLVQNEAGELLSGTRLVLENLDGGGSVPESYEFETTSGSDGRFTWDGAPDAPVHFYIYKAGYEQKRRQLLKPDIENIVTLHKSRTVKGQVVDADTGAAVKKFRIGVGRDIGDRFYPDWPGMKDYSDENGMFTLDLNEEQNVAIKAEADDYAEKIMPLPSPQDGVVQVTLALKPSPALHGVVVSAGGQPQPGVSLTLARSNGSGSASLAGAKLRSYSDSKVTVTDGEGKFALPSPPENGVLVAVGEAGFARTTIEEVRASSKVVLQPFARIEATLKIGGQAAAGKDLIVTFNDLGVGSDWDAYKRTTDEQGKVIFDHVPAGEVQIQRLVQQGKNSWGYSYGKYVTVKPGETTQVSLGDDGAVLVGHYRVEVQTTDDAPLQVEGRMSSVMQMPSFQTAEQWQAFYNTPEGKAFQRQRKNYSAEVRPDGAFILENVAPGKYSLSLDARGGGERAWQHPVIAAGHNEITVPEDFNPTEPIDVGEIVLEPTTTQSR
jgi:hypothetical protein